MFLTIGITGLYFAGEPEFKANFVFVGIVIQLIFCLVILLAGFQLLGWHSYFYRKGITTFTHIQFEKAKSEKLEAVKTGKMT